MSTPIYTLTPGAAQQNLQNDGLDALGLTTVALSPHWGSVPLGGYDANTLTLSAPPVLRAPFRGMLAGAFAPASSTLNAGVSENDTSLQVAAGEGARFPSPTGGGSVLVTLSSPDGSKRETAACTARSGDTLTVVRGFGGTAKQSFSAGDMVSLRLGRGNRSVEFSGADAQPLMTACAVYRLHPQAVLRLERLMSVRYGPPGVRPVACCMVVRGAEHFETDQFFEAAADLPVTGPISFHDRRGLIVDPIYVASVFDDLLGWLPALRPASVAGNVTDTNGIRPISQLENDTLLHFINPHGATFQPVATDATLVTADIVGNPSGNLPPSGLVLLAPGDRIQAHANEVGRLRWGWATNGVMDRLPLTPPALPPGVTLNRQFLRVCVVDVVWSLLGNRTDDDVLGIQADDGRIPPDLLPEVRDMVEIDYLVDGPDSLAEATRVLQLPNQDMILAVSPTLDTALLTPNLSGASAHWPAFPVAAVPAGTAVPASIPPGSVTAAFMSPTSNDVVVTLSGVVPAEAHVRIYPQQFVEIAAIAEEPSFVRGDGGANIAGSGTVSLFLPNPFNLATGPERPTPATLTLDIVITPRIGARRLFGAVNVNVSAGPATVPATPFTGAGVMSVLPTVVQGLAPSPMFGVPMPAPPPPGPPPTNVLELVISKLSEPSPRQSPRLPTMARFESLAVTGTINPSPLPPGSLLWEAVVTGARWSAESRSSQHDLGNPGNPAGPDVHAPGVHVSGALAYDVALVALRRVQPMIPWPSTAGVNPGWVVASLGNNFNPPDDSANVANTGVGVLLRTIAVGCETSWLSSLEPPPEGLTVQQMIADAAAAMSLTPPAITISIQNEPRVQREVRREFFIAKHGLRDAQWSLLRAVTEARELIYIESPQFARTARPGATDEDYEVDLVAVIQETLDAHPNLKVIICTPRLSDFATNWRGWSRHHYRARNEAVGMLTSSASERVAVFHPVGFPGRTGFIRTTSVVVDDVWSLVGTSHFRRRGMTFDGSVSIASFDRELQSGYSKKVRDYRRALMALKMRVPVPALGQPASGDWVRLGHPDSAFALVQDLLAQGGLGRIQPLWPGPSDNTILPAQDDVADPDGSTDDKFMTTLAGSLQELGDE